MLKVKKVKRERGLHAGLLLMAKPFWRDDRYQKSVILITEHSEEGSSGVIINKESNANLHLDLRDLNISFPLYYGGPFDRKEMLSLHNQTHLAGSETVTNGISIGSGVDVLKEMVGPHNHLDLTKVRFFSGHVNWKGGQLEKEITEGKWWTSRLNAKEFFATEADILWSKKLVSDGHVYGLLAWLPEPSLN
jgi:putative transcriptional regulator